MMYAVELTATPKTEGGQEEKLALPVSAPTILYPTEEEVLALVNRLEPVIAFRDKHTNHTFSTVLTGIPFLGNDFFLDHLSSAPPKPYTHESLIRFFAHLYYEQAKCTYADGHAYIWDARTGQEDKFADDWIDTIVSRSYPILFIHRHVWDAHQHTLDQLYVIAGMYKNVITSGLETNTFQEVCVRFPPRTWTMLTVARVMFELHGKKS